MSNVSTRTAKKEQAALGYWCVLSEMGTFGGKLRQDSPKHALPTSIFASANAEVGT